MEEWYGTCMGCNLVAFSVAFHLLFIHPLARNVVTPVHSLSPQQQQHQQQCSLCNLTSMALLDGNQCSFTPPRHLVRIGLSPGSRRPRILNAEEKSSRFSTTLTHYFDATR